MPMFLPCLQLALSVVVYELPEANAFAAEPSPKLNPREVVQLHLEALGRNDRPFTNAGISLVFRFASSRFRARMGGLKGFSRAFRSPPWRPLVHHHSATSKRPLTTDRSAAVLVVASDERGRGTAFVFLLARRADGPHPRCWLLEGIRRIERTPFPEPPVAPPRVHI